MSNVTAKLAALVTHDTNTVCRLAALNALSLIGFNSNTCSIIVGVLKSDKDVYVRLRAANILIDDAKERGLALPKESLAAMTELLKPEWDQEIIWQSAYYLGCLGRDAREALPSLEGLKTHPSGKVRHYALEAIGKLGPATRTTPYIVQKGDTLSRIARRSGVSVKDIVEASALANPDDIGMGEELKIPVMNQRSAGPGLSKRQTPVTNRTDAAAP
ncbi:MAG: LysM peptidoglycan-binding domain-containing protein [bacterium]